LTASCYKKAIPLPRPFPPFALRQNGNFRPRPPAAPGWAARLAAADLLNRVLDGRRTLDEAMGLSLPFSNLSGPDRGFARAMASEALRALGHIDLGLANLLDRPLDTASPLARALLRVGAAQLWRMGVPVHAAVSATVEAARRGGVERSAGLINAVLRKCDTEAKRTEVQALPPGLIWPDWLRVRFGAALGVGPAKRMAEAQLRPAPLDLTFKSDPAAWLEPLQAEQTGPLSARIADAEGAIEDLPGYGDGVWWVQDLAASLPVRLLAPQAGETIADLCAAPGGKTMQIAASGAQVFAVDEDGERLERVAENIARTGLSAELFAADARRWRPKTPLDGVLLDAPCSALGTLRRHPEGAWNKTPTLPESISGLQKQLLASAREMLKPGGRLVYAVCSPLPEEGVAVAQAALTTAGWRADAEAGLRAGLPASAALGPGWLVSPGVIDDRDHDAFFIASLVKT